MKMEFNYINKKLFLLIPLVAMLILSMFLLSYGVKETPIVLRQVALSILNTATIWLGCMFIVQFLWKKYPWEQYPVKHLLIEIVLILIYTLAVSWLIFWLSVNFWDLPMFTDVALGVFITLLITFLITAIHESVFFYQQWKFNFSKSVRLERDNLAARYEALRSQINPHFLFNSLNSLTNIVEDNKTAVDYIGNLSELLRYMLKSNEKELVLLREELAVLRHFVNLQKMRFKENLQIRVDVSESSYHYALPPLALQMLVENAIKHNVITSDRPLSMRIWVENTTLIAENNLQRKEVGNSTGQGLKNISGRLKLFTTKELKVEESATHFRVSLPLLQVEL